MGNLVLDIGINDADYPVAKKINGKLVICPIYRKWLDMLKRCYSKKFQEKRPNYIGCTVCDEWLTFSGFESWMKNQDFKGKSLDKDIILVGNKKYSADNCVFVNPLTNSFMSDRANARGSYPIGVSLELKLNKFRARCNNPFTKKNEYLGLFDYPNQAHEAWRKRKHELACQLAELQDDPRVAMALRSRYAH